MWQSETWNGQEADFRFYVFILLVLIYISQPDGVWLRNIIGTIWNFS